MIILIIGSIGGIIIGTIITQVIIIPYMDKWLEKRWMNKHDN